MLFCWQLWPRWACLNLRSSGAPVFSFREVGYSSKHWNLESKPHAKRILSENPNLPILPPDEPQRNVWTNRNEIDILWIDDISDPVPKSRLNRIILHNTILYKYMWSYSRRNNVVLWRLCFASLVRNTISTQSPDTMSVLFNYLLSCRRCLFMITGTLKESTDYSQAVDC